MCQKDTVTISESDISPFQEFFGASLSVEVQLIKSAVLPTFLIMDMVGNEWQWKVLDEWPRQVQKSLTGRN